GNNVAHSLIQGGSLAGMQVVVATPDGLGPDATIVAEARKLAGGTGGAVDTVSDPGEAVKGADVVYTDVWTSMGDREDEDGSRRRLLAPYRVDSELMAQASESAIFMHCLPAHRGDEVVTEVIDGPQSAVADQAENRMHTEQGLLVALLTGALTGAR
ncbi:MAG TPA: ornithine carbamoyltransferase, partial [Acidimicrobiia bacterium]